MKRVVLFIIACVVCSSLFAQTKSEMKLAYEFRTDIPKSVLKETRSWPDKYGILHHDWIENLNGKSIDLQGNVLFPQYDYTQLERHCGRFWVMTVGGKKGVVNNSGEVLIPFEYDAINFSYITDGYVSAWKKGELGRGKRIKIIDNPSFQEMWDSDTATFNNNAWVDRFAYYYNQKKYRKAKYCIDYYTQFEQVDVYSTQTLPLFQQVRYNLLTFEQRKDYTTVVDFVKESRLPGTHYDASKMALVLDHPEIYTLDQLEMVNREVEYINDNYYTCIRGVAQQAEAKERRERAAVAAALILGAAAMTTATVITEQQAQKAQQPSKSASTASSKPTKGMSKVAQSFKKDTDVPASGNNDAVDEGDDDPNYGEVEVEEIHVTCDRCGGSGKCQECGGTGHVDGIGDHPESCHACKHEHGKCVGCQGRGYNIKYK